MSDHDDVMCAQCKHESRDHGSRGCLNDGPPWCGCSNSIVTVLRHALSERDAQLERTEERSREWALALQSLTPGGSEYVDDPAACVATVRQIKMNQHEAILNAVKARKEADAQLARAHDAVNKARHAMSLARMDREDAQKQLAEARREIADRADAENANCDMIGKLIDERDALAGLLREADAVVVELAKMVPAVGHGFAEARRLVTAWRAHDGGGVTWKT